ncbi:hypothetical protein BDQ12DRAFT_668780 [Crucibulum laeve]|uniref:Uncharacterized protein n=1 Tax=Crucibulum laeve TaxID=68775 RepID=A0A5C3LPV3_9AGAR|nr:hypothetical protein BDQ12DRAFT_668780 [Crucibulum laeve]
MTLYVFVSSLLFDSPATNTEKEKGLKKDVYLRLLSAVCDLAILDMYIKNRRALGLCAPIPPAEANMSHPPDIAKADLEAAPITTVRFMDSSAWMLLEGADEEREGGCKQGIERFYYGQWRSSIRYVWRARPALGAGR